MTGLLVLNVVKPFLLCALVGFAVSVAPAQSQGVEAGEAVPPAAVDPSAAAALATESSAEAGYAALLAEHVTQGLVNYTALARDERLDAYLVFLGEESPAALPTAAAQLARWINAYNAFTLKLVAEHHPLASINELAGGGRYGAPGVGGTAWDLRMALVGQRRYTLREIEQRCLAPEFGDVRVRFALSNGAVSGPLLRSEPYATDRLDRQLEEQARAFVRRRCQFQLDRKRARLSALFTWHARDFGGEESQRLEFVARYVEAAAVVESLRIEPAAWRVESLHFDWSLNETPGSRPRDSR